jgi:hypothetical protein
VVPIKDGDADAGLQRELVELRHFAHPEAI